MSLPPHSGSVLRHAISAVSIASISVTYAVLRWTQRARIAGNCEADVVRDALSTGGKLAMAGIMLTALLLLTMSALDVELGLPTALAGIATAVIVSLLAGRSPVTLAKSVSWGVLPLVPCAIAWAAASAGVPAPVQLAVSVLLVVPVAPLLARVVFQPIADASVLVLLIVSLALHFLLSGLGLLFFGPEGSRTSPLASGTLTLGDGFTVSGQVILMVSSAIVLSGLFFLVFERTVMGKALRATAVNRRGAQIVGIPITQAGRLAFLLAAAIGALCGMLIAPFTTIYYDTGFLIGLKAFVGAIIGGLSSFPLAVGGALLVGLIESFASFWASAFKEVIVFTLIIPVLLWRSIASSRQGRHDEDES
jgi:branched-chain amino acid transport system permease protein